MENGEPSPASGDLLFAGVNIILASTHQDLPAIQDAASSPPEGNDESDFEENNDVPITLHSVCNIDDLLLGNASILQLETRHLGSACLPIRQTGGYANSNGNVTMFVLACDGPLHGRRWSFMSTTATLTVSPVHVHSWDWRSTYQGTLSRNNEQVEVGVRAFDQHNRALRTYLGIAQSYIHVATSLIQFREELLFNVDRSEFAEEEWEVLLSLRFQENLVGLVRDGQSVLHGRGKLQAFTAEELISGPRELFTQDCSFRPPSDAHLMSCPIRLLLEAFSHWTYIASGETSVISGFQGVGTVLTEAVINDSQHNWTISNFGRNATCYFRREHVCRKFCHLQGYQPVSDPGYAGPGSIDTEW